MLLSDNETKIDMLNNKAIAKTIADLICESPDKPLSIGVHGDWGAGKSSILAMVEDELSSRDGGIVCIKFNGWKHQGFEDAKIALMSSIVSELAKNQTLADKGKKILKKLWKSINWLSVAKSVGSAAFSLTTGTPPISLIHPSIDGIKAVVGKDGGEAAIENIGSYVSDARVGEDNSITKEFSEFQDSFEELLEESKIKKLVVLIDDLDRCLPKVTIETLEAVRLFMFTKYTAFVIAADEAMIEYAVHQHFPGLPGKDDITRNEYDYSKRYLEKLIQVPFKIPVLGKVESEMYITLLMICSRINEDDEVFESLLSASVEKMERPWENTGLSIDDLKQILGDEYDSVSNEINVAIQIADILANNTQGNPRNIKRFLNMLLLRKEMAIARGFGDYVHLPVLAKLMLAEYYFPAEYANIALALDVDDGKCSLLARFEERLTESPQARAREPKNNFDEATETDKTHDEKLTDEWSKNLAFRKWVMNQPLLGTEDLRPYFFACKEREDFFKGRIISGQLSELIHKLMGRSFNVVSATDEIKSLSETEVGIVFDGLSARIKKEGDISKAPDGIAGIRHLVGCKPQLEERLLNLIESYDCKAVGPWMVAGWDKSIVSANGKARLQKYFAKLRADGSRAVKGALKATEK